MTDIEYIGLPRSTFDALVSERDEAKAKYIEVVNKYYELSLKYSDVVDKYTVLLELLRGSDESGTAIRN